MKPHDTTPRVGVFVCDCGGKIDASIDTETLVQRTRQIPEVVYAAHDAFPCSKDGQERICQAVEDLHLNRVLIAGCTPRLVEKLFRDAIQSTELEPSYLNIADIREQCTYVHAQDRDEALNKATALIDMGVARLVTTSPIRPHSSPVTKAALVIGSGLSALTVALSLATGNVRVTLVETADKLGGPAADLEKRTRQLIEERIQEVHKNTKIDALLNAQISQLAGHPGDYEVRIQQDYKTISIKAGVIVVANSARPKALISEVWYDRARVKTQAEFEMELEAGAQVVPIENIVMILCAEASQREHCSRVCCNTAIHQAMRAKELYPGASITILFRDLYLGGIGEAYEAEMVEARKKGITFFRYRKETPPEIGEKNVDVLDTLTGEPVRLPYDRVVLTMPLIPSENAPALASLLSLPQDDFGFLAEPRIRLRPGRYADPGIYVLGSAQQPADTAEALFQAYLTSSRAARFLRQESITVDSTVARIDAAICTGCGNCTRVCPTSAIQLEKRDGILSLSQVDDMLCIGCGNCVVVCPPKAISLPGWDNVEIPAQIQAALHPSGVEGGSGRPTPKVVALCCEWSAYAAADMAGARRLSYPACVRILRMNCSARFDPYHILWAFLNGADGVFLGACPPGECHYGTGNLYAKERIEVLQKELAHHGIDPNRIHLEYMSVDDGYKFAQALTEFVEEVKTDMKFPNR